MEGKGSHSQLLWWGWWSLVVLAVGMMMVSSEDEADDPPDPNPLRKGPGKRVAYILRCFTRGPYHNKRAILHRIFSKMQILWTILGATQSFAAGKTYNRRMPGGRPHRRPAPDAHRADRAVEGARRRRHSRSCSACRPGPPSGSESYSNKKRPATALTLPQLFATGKMTTAQLEGLHKLCLQWVACTGIPFNAFDHETFKEWMAALRAKYTPPSKCVSCGL
jgi:hypothetical protein